MDGRIDLAFSQKRRMMCSKFPYLAFEGGQGDDYQSLASRNDPFPEHFDHEQQKESR
jgi:hypothetical protein